MVTMQQAGAKECFDAIYAQPDPRAYYGGLGALDYEVPEHGVRVFARVLAAMAVERPTVVDLCCSYGVNAALLKHDLTLDRLYEHYTDDRLVEVSTDELAVIDRAFFADHCHDDRTRVVGLDAAAPAIDYATRVGLLDAGFAENLELEPPSDMLAAHVEEADLVTVTGGVGYITATTFERLLECRGAPQPPWVAALCLRTVPYEPVASCLEQFGLVTEQLSNVTYPQRRFADAAEREYALGELSTLDVDPTGKEADGRYHVNVYVSVPRAEADRASVQSLFTDLAT